MILVEKINGKSPLGRPRHRQGYNIKMYLSRCGGVARNGFLWLRTRTSGRNL